MAVDIIREIGAEYTTPAKIINFKPRGARKTISKPSIPTHGRIFGNGNPEELRFGGVASRNEKPQPRQYIAGTRGWEFDFNTGNYVPIGPVKQLRDRFGRFMKGGV